MTKISIVIPTLNRSMYLKKLLRSLIKQNFPRDNYEILVVDNGSIDNTRNITNEAISLFTKHHIRYIYEPVPGLLSGRHRGVLEAQGDILTFVDDDIEADKDWLQAISDSFQNISVKLVGGRNLPKYETNPPDWLQWFWIDHAFGKTCAELSLLDFGEEVREIDANYVWGLNFSIHRQALLDLGGFHPDCIPKHLQHFQGDGETDLAKALPGRQGDALGTAFNRQTAADIAAYLADPAGKAPKAVSLPWGKGPRSRFPQPPGPPL